MGGILTSGLRDYVPLKKESSMPWAVAAPAIASLAGTVGGAIMGSRSANKATKAQSDANTQALQFQREQEAARRQDYQRAMQAYEVNRNALLKRYGIDVGPSTYAQPAQAPQGAGFAPQGRPPMPPQGAPMGRPMGVTGAPAGGMSSRGGDLRSLIASGRFGGGGGYNPRGY